MALGTWGSASRGRVGRGFGVFSGRLQLRHLQLNLWLTLGAVIGFMIDVAFDHDRSRRSRDPRAPRASDPQGHNHGRTPPHGRAGAHVADLLRETEVAWYLAVHRLLRCVAALHESRKSLGVTVSFTTGFRSLLQPVRPFGQKRDGGS